MVSGVLDAQLASSQRRRYEQCLADLGCEVHSLPADPALPDSTFVEDTAIVFDTIAVITRPGAESRRPETAAVAAALEPYRETISIEAPGTLEGGDVLVVGRKVYVGLSARSNRRGYEQLRAILEPRGYTVASVQIGECLHLKSAVTQVGPDRLLINPRWVDPRDFPGFDLIDVDPAEPFAANALLIGDTVILPDAFERTRETLIERGIRVMPVDVSELAKAEGGVTCCSLIFEGAHPPR